MVAFSCVFGAKLVLADVDETIAESRKGDTHFRIVRVGQQEGAYHNESKLILQIIDIVSGKIVATSDITDNYYGSSIFGTPKLEISQESPKRNLVLFQCRRGGDGDHTENTLYIFGYENKRLNKIGEQNIFNTELFEKNNLFHQIRGKTVLTFCHVCDGWEVSAPENIFLIPISISIIDEKINVKCILSETEKEVLIRNFEKQKIKNLEEQQSYGRKSYEQYVNELSQEFYSIIK